MVLKYIEHTVLIFLTQKYRKNCRRQSFFIQRHTIFFIPQTIVPKFKGNDVTLHNNKLYFRYTMKKTFILTLLSAAWLSAGAQTIPLGGTWHVTLTDSNVARDVMLPGTLDTNHVGDIPTDTIETTHLTRCHAYKGAATYSRTITVEKDKAWKKKHPMLFLERCKPSWIYLDGKLIDSCCNISTPQRYMLPPLRPGQHKLDIVVDNSCGVPEQLYASSHAYTEDTQTNWNGIIGRFFLSLDGTDSVAARGTDEAEWLPCFRNFHIEGAHFYADGHKVFLRGKHDACVWPKTGHVPMDEASWMRYLSVCKDYGINHIRFHSWCPPEAAFAVADRLGIYLQPELPFWGSFDDKDSTLMTFLHNEGVNILREYGHHASFRMMALGNELWGSIDAMARFVSDFRAIAPDKLYTFGSNYYLGYQGIKPGMDYFTTCRIGGEAWGAYTTHTRGSFSFADAADGGMINHFRPNTSLNFDEACNKWAPARDGKTAGTPIISHETGQFQTYPDYAEMKKYDATVFKPYNFAVFRRRLAEAGLLDKAQDFHKASGLWSVRLYKADIEMDLRTRNMAGFQLLDLQDYPGQGSAFVGVLDAFMETKGITTPDEWTQWCAPVVPLMVTDSLCFAEGDTLKAHLQIANYGAKSLRGQKLEWRLVYADGGCEQYNAALPHGTLDIDTDEEGLVDIGDIRVPMRITKGDINGARDDMYVASRKIIMRLSIDDGRVDNRRASNTYEMWVYTTPKNIDYLKKGIVVTRKMSDNVIAQLQKGAKVLWIPDSLPHTVGALFQTDYWNYRMFKTICENNKKAVSPGTLGILTDPKQPLLSRFPSEMHSNWQWFPVVKHSKPLILDCFDTSFSPLVEVIDNVERAHRLGLVMEWRVGRGSLLLSMTDIDALWKEGHPEGRAFCETVFNYMHSDAFAPKNEISVQRLLETLNAEPHHAALKELNNISQY